MSEYAKIHYWARKNRQPACMECGSSQRLQMALSPDAPADNLRFDEAIKCVYSSDPGDYITLCLTCHRQLDRVHAQRARKRGLQRELRLMQRSRAAENGRYPRCTVCGNAVVAGQLGDIHLSCRSNFGASA